MRSVFLVLLTLFAAKLFSYSMFYELGAVFHFSAWVLFFVVYYFEACRRQRLIYIGLFYSFWPLIFIYDLWPNLPELYLLPLLFPLVPLLFEGLRRGFAGSPLMLATEWVLFEALRSFTDLGLSMNISLAYFDSSFLLKIGTLGGPFLFSFCLAFCAASLGLSLARRRSYLLFPLAVLSLTWWVAFWNLPFYKDSVTLNVLGIQVGQPSPQENTGDFKFYPELRQPLQNRDFATADRIYMRAAADLLKGHSGDPAILVFPETFLSDATMAKQFYFENQSAFSPRSHWVIPHFRKSGEGQKWFNSSSVFAEGELKGVYDKQKASFSPDYQERPLQIKPFSLTVEGQLVKWGVLICFDLDFLKPVADWVRQGVQLIVVPSDDAYPKIASWHYRFAALQAAWHNVAIFKLDSAYASGIFDSQGKLHGSLGALQVSRRRIDQEVRVPMHSGTAYTKLGDFPFIVGLVILYLMQLIYVRRSAYRFTE